MKDAYYFPHDSTAKDDPKCSMLIEQMGLEGYGIYWVLVEILRDQPEFRYPLAMIPIIARKYNTTAEKVKIVIGSYGLFMIDNNEFFSESLCKRMERFRELKLLNSEKGKRSGEARRMLALGKSSVVHQGLNLGSTLVEQGELGEESKESKDNILKALFDFKEMRVRMKKPMTDRAVEILLARLNRLGKTPEEKVAILEQSILNGWQGIWAIKEEPVAIACKDRFANVKG